MRFLLLSMCFLGTILMCTATVDEELAKVEQELEKLELNKAKKELANDIEMYLHPKAAAKKSLKNKVEEVQETAEVKEAKSVDDEKVTEANLDELVSMFKAKDEKREAEEKLKRSLELILESELNKRSSVPIVKNKCIGAKDERDDCEVLKKANKCGGKYTDIMSQVCYKTCHCDKCMDTVEKSRCNVFSKLGMCERLVKKMEEYCPGTCGYCKMPAPPSCSKSQFGCCWDEITSKTDKDGSNCPKCADAYRNVCKTFSPDCMNQNSAGMFMRKHCPFTCGRCVEKCVDHPDHSMYCEFWEKQGMCKTNKDSLKVFCPKTCGFCGEV